MNQFAYHRGNIFHCPENWTWNGQNFCDHDIWFVCGGKGRLTNAGRSYELTGGDCFIFSPGDRHHAVHDPRFPLTVIAVHFAFRHADAQRPLPYYTKIENCDFMAALLSRSIQCAREKEFARAEFWLEAAIRCCCETTEREAARVVEGRYSREIEEICSSIMNDPGAEYNVADLARKCFLSADHFTRLFRTAKGCSPREFIIRCRIEYACELLQESSMGLADVAAIAGYGNVYFFSRQFKKMTGSAPGRYRKQRRNEENNPVDL